MDITIRPIKAELKEAEKLLILESKVFNDCKYSTNEILNIIGMAGNRIFVATLDEAFVGFTSLLRVNTLHYKGIWVDLIGVDPLYQKRGIARLLLSKAIAYARTEGVELMSGLIAKNNTASLKAFTAQSFNLVEKDYTLAIQTLKDIND